MDDITASLGLNDDNGQTSLNFHNDEKNINILLLNNLYNKLLSINKKNNFNKSQPVIILIDNFNEILLNNANSKRSIEVIQSIIKMQSLVK